MLPAATLVQHFVRAKPYTEYLTAFAKPHELDSWRSFESHVSLSGAQTALVRSFSRRMNVLCVSGTWCGDCVQQVPFLAKIAGAHPALGPGDAAGIDLRFLERDAVPELMEHLKICGGARVPVALFLNEDFDFVALAGDRTLARYRALAARQLGPSCPLPGAPVPPDEIAATLQNWLDEFERVALLLRLSGKLRQRHQD